MMMMMTQFITTALQGCL